MASGQPDVLTTWNTFYASTYWNMRFSVAGAAMDAHVKSGIMLRDRTRNLVVVGRQPHPNPNYASYSPGGRPHCAAAVDPLVRFEAPLGLFHSRDVSPFLSRALHGAALFLSWDCASVLC